MTTHVGPTEIAALVLGPRPFVSATAAAPPASLGIGGRIRLWTIALVLLVLWFLGLVSSYTMGGFIHILLVLAIIAVLVRVIQGRRAV
jgi:hypothetical protein